MTARVVATTAFVAVCDDCDGGWNSGPEFDPADAEHLADIHDQDHHER